MTAVVEVLASFQTEGCAYANVNSVASAVSTTLGIVFPLRGSIAELSWMKNIRKSAKKTEVCAATRPRFDHLNRWWDFWVAAPPNKLLPDNMVRIKAMCFLALDGFMRPKDMTKIPVGSPSYFYFRQHGEGCAQLHAGFLQPKESDSFKWFVIEPYHMEPNLCTVCVVREYLVRRAKSWSPALKTLQILEKTGAKSQKVVPVSALFSSSQINKGVGKYPPLGKERISKVIKEAFIKFGGFPADFRGKDVRALSASLAFNLGAAEERIISSGRWAGWGVIAKHYVRRGPVRQFSVQKMAVLSMPAVLRTRTETG